MNTRLQAMKTNSDQEREISFYPLVYLMVFNMSYVSLQQCFCMEALQKFVSFSHKENVCNILNIRQCSYSIP